MSQYSYTKKPNWLGDGSRNMSNLSGNTTLSNIFPSARGWVSPMAGAGFDLASAMTWTSGIISVTSVAHGLTTGQWVTITGATPSGYNGHYQVTVVTADSFTYALASNPGTANATQTITSASISNSIVTNVKTSHGLISDNIITIAGVTPSGYNGTYRVTVIDANTFTYKNQSISTAITVAGTVTPTGMIYKSSEVLVAIGGLDTLYADASLTPIFSAVISYSGTSTVVTGNTITVTITSSEPVVVTGNPFITLTIGSSTNFMTYNVASSTSTSLVFTYQVVAGDHATAGNVSVGATMVGTVSIGDILPNRTVAGAVQPVSSLSYTAPNTSTTVVN